jgi:hypothetical protein
LVHIGEALREAQETTPDRDKLRQLAAARRQLIASVADLGASIAEDSGRSLSPSVRDELEQTLSAALSDPAAAEALRTGRLVRALETDGVEPVDLDGAVAGGAAVRARRATARPKAKGADEPEDLDAHRRRKEAESAVSAAEREQNTAAERARLAAEAESAAQQASDDAEARRDELSERIDDLQRQLTQLRAELDDAGDEVDAATRKAMAAGRQRAAAEREVVAAEAETERLRVRLEKL